MAWIPYRPPPAAPEPGRPGIIELVEGLARRVEEALEDGVTHSVLVVGEQGSGKSRILAALAAELIRRGLRAHYGMGLPRGRHDYVILDDLAALITAWEWQTRAARLLRKVEVLARELGRAGYAAAFPRLSDALKFMRERARALFLFPRLALREDYGIDAGCDVLAVLTKRAPAPEWAELRREGALPRGRRYCVRWGEFRWYSDPLWRKLYESVQARRAELLGRWLKELKELEGLEGLVEPGDPVLAVVEWIVRKSYEALLRALADESAAGAPDDAVSAALSKFGAAPFEGWLDLEGDIVRLYTPLVNGVGGTSLESFALMVNKALDRGAARVARSGRRRRVEIALEDLLELVRNYGRDRGQFQW